MAAIVFANQGASTLASAVSTTSTTLEVVDASTFPDLALGESFYLTLENVARTAYEICTVIAINKSANLLTVQRGVDGTIPLSHSPGDYAENRVTRATLELIQQPGSPTLLPTPTVVGQIAQVNGSLQWVADQVVHGGSF